MEDPGGPYRIALAVILLCCSAAFSASETALFSMRQNPKPQNKLWLRIKEMRDTPEKTLSTILLGNTAVNVVFTSSVTALALSLPHLSRERAEGAAAVASFILLLIFGEVGPKTLGCLKPLAVLSLTSTPLWHLRTLLSPLTHALTVVNHGLGTLLPSNPDETQVSQQQLVEAAVDVCEQSGAVKADTGQAIRNIMATTETSVRKIMTPRATVQAVEANQTVREAAALMVNTGLSRLPVFKGGLDAVIGLVHLKDLLPLMVQEEHAPLDELIRPIYRASAADTVSEVLRALRQQGAHMSAVFNSQQRLIGIATVEDLVEEIVGEIADEHELFKAAGGN